MTPEERFAAMEREWQAMADPEAEVFIDSDASPAWVRLVFEHAYLAGRLAGAEDMKSTHATLVDVAGSLTYAAPEMRGMWEKELNRALHELREALSPPEGAREEKSDG